MGGLNLLIDFLIVAGITVNAIILVVSFKGKTHYLRSRLFQSIFFILLSYIIVSYGVFHQVKWIQYLAIILGGATYLLGPLIYFYFKSLSEDFDNSLKHIFKHFLLFSLYFALISLPLLISAFNEEFIFQYLKEINNNNLFLDIIEVAFIVFYLTLSLRLFYGLRNDLKNHYSAFNYRNILWIEHLIYGLMICAIVQFILSIASSYSVSSDYLDLFQISVYVSFICYLGYFGLQQHSPETSETTIDTIQVTAEKRIYVTTEEIDNISKKIDTVFAEDKPYLDENLTLRKLSGMLGTSDKKLSFYLNNHLNTSFYNFVNKHRVQVFKEKVSDDQNNHLSILGIAFESGFKSKSSFNRIFKNQTGLSPSEYLKSI